jgi:hypothetical protein
MLLHGRKITGGCCSAACSHVYTADTDFDSVAIDNHIDTAADACIPFPTAPWSLGLVFAALSLAACGPAGIKNRNRRCALARGKRPRFRSVRILFALPAMNAHGKRKRDVFRWKDGRR